MPGSLVHVPPQLAGFVLVEFAKPLKLDGADPPLSEFFFAHCAPQKVTCWPTTAFRSPITKPVTIGVGVGVGVGVATLMLNEQVAVLLLASVAVHVTFVLPWGKTEPDAGVQAVVTPGQLSLAAGAG